MEHTVNKNTACFIICLKTTEIYKWQQQRHTLNNYYIVKITRDTRESTSKRDATYASTEPTRPPEGATRPLFSRLACSHSLYFLSHHRHRRGERDCRQICNFPAYPISTPAKENSFNNPYNYTVCAHVL